MREVRLSTSQTHLVKMLVGDGAKWRNTGWALACFLSSDALLGKNLSEVDTVISERCIFHLINCLERTVKRAGHRIPLKLCSEDSHLFSACYIDN